MDNFGFTETEWNLAKEEIKATLIGIAKAKGTIFYSDLVGQITAVRLEPHQFALFHMLGEISGDEHEQERGMLSALVITKEEHLPGSGFFKLAESLGYNVEDELVFWVEEVKKVHDYWKAH